MGRGRKPLGDHAMSDAERQQRHRDRRVAELAEELAARRIADLEREVARLREEVTHLRSSGVSQAD